MFPLCDTTRSRSLPLVNRLLIEADLAVLRTLLWPI